MALPMASLDAQEAVRGTLENPVQGIRQFWDLTPAQKAQPCEVRFECDVTYYDGNWKLLFIQDGTGEGAFVPPRDLRFPFNSGQHLVVSGQMYPPEHGCHV